LLEEREGREDLPNAWYANRDWGSGGESVSSSHRRQRARIWACAAARCGGDGSEDDGGLLFAYLGRVRQFPICWTGPLESDA
jgi:hypothetical protein